MRNIITACMVLATMAALAQPATKADALRVYREGDLTQAKAIIDKVIQDPSTHNDPEIWLIRGFIYKDIFKKVDQGAATSKARDEALSCLLKAVRKDTAERYIENSIQAYEYLATTVFNDAAKAITALDHENAIRLYNQYREVELALHPNADLDPKDIEFYNALGTLYTKLIMEEQDLSYFDKATSAYEVVLGIEQDNYGANYNMATLFYNRGVHNIFSISPENDIPSIHDIQLVSKEYFIQALPYMLKAHELRPNRKETLLGLEGIYYSLQDRERSELYRMLYEELQDREQEKR